MDANEYITAAKYRAEYVDTSLHRSKRRIQFSFPCSACNDLPGSHVPGCVFAPPRVNESPRFRLESDFQTWLRDRALAQGWRFYHTWSSKRSDPGYPDTHLVQGVYDVMAELKMPGELPEPAQIMWLTALQEARVGIATHWACLWMPDMEEAILGYLAAPSEGNPPGIWKENPHA